MDEAEIRRLLAEGPQPMDRGDRQIEIERIVERLDSAFGRSIVAIGLYGSTARGADQPFSDIEMFCVLKKPDEDRRLEWVYGNGKAEDQLFGEDVVRRKAPELDEVWPVTHAA